MLFNGKEISAAEIQAKMDELAQLTKLKKEFKKAGLINEKVGGVPKVKPAEVTLMVKSFEPTIAAMAKTLAKLFSVDYKGQDSISMNISDDYAVIIRDRKITAKKAEERKEKAKIDGCIVSIKAGQTEEICVKAYTKEIYDKAVAQLAKEKADAEEKAKTGTTKPATEEVKK